MNYYPSPTEEIRALRSGREQVAEMISRYPRVSASEVQQILNFLKTARHLEIGLLTSNDALRPRLDAFMADHKTHFRVTWGEGAAVVAGILGLLVVLWLVWGAFS